MLSEGAMVCTKYANPLLTRILWKVGEIRLSGVPGPDPVPGATPKPARNGLYKVGRVS
jgi:hypothetical protein